MGTSKYPKDRVILPNGMTLFIYKHRVILKLASKTFRLIPESMRGQDSWTKNGNGSDIVIRAEKMEGIDQAKTSEHPEDFVCIRRKELDQLRRAARHATLR